MDNEKKLKCENPEIQALDDESMDKIAGGLSYNPDEFTISNDDLKGYSVSYSNGY